MLLFYRRLPMLRGQDHMGRALVAAFAVTSKNEPLAQVLATIAWRRGNFAWLSGVSSEYDIISPASLASA